MPLYQQVADLIRQRIASGELPPGYQVPSEHELVDEHGVSRITATKALKLLRDDGLIYTLQGRGSFVAPESAPRVTREKMFERIAREVAERIQSGELQPDYPIPSETTLAQEYGVAKGTVRQAVALLRDQQWVFTVPHRGTYVSSPDKWPKRPS